MQERKPLHLLIEGGRKLTLNLRDAHPDRPLIGTTNPLTALPDYPTHALKPGEFKYLKLLQIIFALREKRNDADDRIQELVDLLSETRKRFGLTDNQPLVVAFGGSHTSYYHNMAAGANLSAGSDRLTIQEHLQRLMRDRSLAKNIELVSEILVERAQTTGFPITIEPLTSIFPELLPQAPLPSEFSDLLARAHDDAVKAGRNDGRRSNGFKRGAVPLLYLREGNGPWEQLVFENSPYTRSTTEGLLRQFAARKEAVPAIEGVLFKLLGPDLEKYAKVDPPIVGARTLEKADLCGLRTIVLDHRRGVITLEAQEMLRNQRFSASVYASH